MRLLKLKCENCGSSLKVKSGTNDIHCEYCGANYKLDDEAQHIKYDDMEKAGYEYEKGKLKARQEHEEEKRKKKVEAREAAIKAEKDAKRRKWKIFGLVLLWIYFLPIMGTYYVWKKTKLSRTGKIAITVGIWLLVVICWVVNYGNTY